jgi:hypothetical protein
LAALAVLVAPVYMAFDSYLSMNSLEPLIWMGCALILIRLVKGGNPRSWLWFGLLSGIGLENKHTMLLFGFALIAGLLLTTERRLLWNRWFLLAGLIALLLFLPNLIWNIQHHFPHVEMLANIRRNQRDVAFSPLGYLGMQIMFFNPPACLIWLTGLGSLLFSRVHRQLRVLGLAYLITLAVLLIIHGKVYYIAPAYPMLLAAGAVMIEQWARFRWPKRLVPVYAVVLVLSGAMIAPTLIPVLPPDAYFAYVKHLPIPQPRIENRATNAMPQFFADRFGWPEMVEAVARVYFSLPAEERAKTAIFGNDYGQSGAIDFYGPRLGLPKALGNHLTYWYWGPRQYTGESCIVLGSRRESEERHFESVEEVGWVGHPYAMKQEQFPILLCRKPKGWTFQQIWPQIKNWN